MTPTPRQTPDEWGAANRVYPATAGVPGKRDPKLTPYMIAFARAAASGQHKRAVLCTAAQCGKTDTMLDIIGERTDTRPANMIYVGPSKDFNTDQFEPRLVGLFDESRNLTRKRLAGGTKDKKTLKRIAGIRIRLAHAGSSTALKSDPAALAIVDEIDEMLANVKGQGDPLGLVERRGDTFADFSSIIASTPSVGIAETVFDPESGLEFFVQVDPRDVVSAIWKLFQQGTMYHWAWPCPHCHAYFVPMGKHLRWAEGATSFAARSTAWLQCPHCRAAIDNSRKAAMNERGLYVCHGQKIVRGRVVGAPKESDTISFWASGLCSPFQTWGDRAAGLIEADNSGDPAEKQVAVNAGLGELYAAGAGDIPEWRHVLRLSAPYPEGQLQPGTLVITCGVDVQQDRLVYVVRAWGARATSWLVTAGELYGDTAEAEVWTMLDDFLQTRWTGPTLKTPLPIKIALIDSGFRPGKPFKVPENKVYEFCRLHRRFVFPSKGASVAMQSPLKKSNIEVNFETKVDKFGLELIKVDSDYFKSWVHERLRRPQDEKGAWFLYTWPPEQEKAAEYYARQIVSEARTKTPAGKAVWIKRARDNHFLDAEALAAAGGWMLSVHSVPTEDEKRVKREVVKVDDGGEKVEVVASTPPETAPQSNASRFAKMAARINKPRGR